MNTDLIDHLRRVLPEAGQGWGKVYCVRHENHYEHISELADSDASSPIVVYDDRYLPNPHFVLNLPEFGAEFLRQIVEQCGKIGFRPLFRSKGKFNGTDMEYKTSVLCPTETDGILLQAYLDAL